MKISQLRYNVVDFCPRTTVIGGRNGNGSVPTGAGTRSSQSSLKSVKQAVGRSRNSTSMGYLISPGVRYLQSTK